jgi:hypothetical protein
MIADGHEECQLGYQIEVLVPHSSLWPPPGTTGRSTSVNRQRHRPSGESIGPTPFRHATAAVQWA